MIFNDCEFGKWNCEYGRKEAFKVYTDEDWADKDLTTPKELSNLIALSTLRRLHRAACPIGSRRQALAFHH